MEIVIIHYHLNPGGVTRIIESQIRAIKLESGETKITLVCGNSNGRNEIEGCPVLCSEMFNYMEAGISGTELTERVSIITGYLKSLINDQTILHCHNLNLGKNPALLMAVFNLASTGVPVLSHCHDFAEDRPMNLALLQKVIPMMTSVSMKQVLYPDLKKTQFAVLSSCDFNRLIGEGIDVTKINLLPNPVLAFNAQRNKTESQISELLKRTPRKKLCLYPVRAITRKNMGEVVLLSVLFKETMQFAVTLAPRNPIEVPQYKRWKNFCRNNDMDVLFEAGALINYEDLIFISDFCITTSIQEGFGMAYLEPWLAGIPVVGRELACVINDFKEHGLIFPALYKGIYVNYAGGLFDFKDLPTDQKEQFILELSGDFDKRQQVLAENPVLSDLFKPVAPEIIKSNQDIISAKFSIKEYGERLFAIYRKISG